MMFRKSALWMRLWSFRRLTSDAAIGSASNLTTSAEVRVKLTFEQPDGYRDEVKARVGQTLLEVAIEHDLEVEGACEGTLACSTCHMIFEKPLFDKLPKTEEEELDMLDLAIGLTDTSRLGCQVKVTEAFDGAKIRLPDESVSQM